MRACISFYIVTATNNISCMPLEPHRKGNHLDYLNGLVSFEKSDFVNTETTNIRAVTSAATSSERY